MRSALAKDGSDAAVTSYVEGFNAMVVKKQWIQTTERELVMEALLGALTGLVTEPAERERLWAVADGLRDF